MLCYNAVSGGGHLREKRGGHKILRANRLWEKEAAACRKTLFRLPQGLPPGFSFYPFSPRAATQIAVVALMDGQFSCN
jgi:hypothetical protein